MDVILGIAAKSLDAAHQLAKALHGPRGWAWQQSISLQATPKSTSLAPEAAARLLLSHDSRTAYILVATHATAEEMLAAVAAAARYQEPAAAAAMSPLKIDVPPAVAAVAPALTTLQQLQQQHDIAANVLLLQLFLACDAVLVLLPTGQGMALAGHGTLMDHSRGGGGGGGGGGPLSAATAWMPRLRLLQGAKRALYKSLRNGNQAGSHSPLPSSPAPRGRPNMVAVAAAAAAAPPAGAAAVSDAAGGDSGSGGGSSAAAVAAATDGGISGGMRQLRSWCSRTRPPTLFFISPGDPDAAKAGCWSPSVSSAPGGTAVQRSRSNHRHGTAAAAITTNTTAASDPRDTANSLLRNLLKRCRPVPLSGTPESTQLCQFDPAVLVLEPGPLALEPDVVHATALAALLEGPGYGVGAAATAACGSSVASELSVATAPLARRGDGLHLLRERLAALVAAAAAAEEESSAAAVAVRSSKPQRPGKADPDATSGSGGRGGGGGCGEEEGITAARQFCVAWQAAAGELYDATVAAWQEAAGKPLDWEPPGVEGGKDGVGQGPGHGASTAHSRTRQRVAAATPSILTPAAAAAIVHGLRAGGTLELAGTWLATAAGSGGLAARLAAELAREAADAALRQYTAAAPPRYPERVHAAAVAAAVAALHAAAPPGPAAASASAWLRAACDGEWRRVPGRRQCSALSATGRPCTRPLHDPSEPHCSETTTWVTATTTGCSVVALTDPFDLQAANTAVSLDDGARVAAQQAAAATSAAAVVAASSGGRGRGGKRGGGGGGSGSAASDSSASSAHTVAQQPAAAHTRHLLVAAAQTADGTTRQCALGPWVTVTRLGPASLYNERRGLTNQPGLNGSGLYLLAVHLETESGVSGHRSGSAGRGGGVGPKAASGGAGKSAMSRVASTSFDTPDASSAAAGGSDNEGGVILDEQSFPSLAEAAAVVQAGRQQGAAAAGPAGPMAPKPVGKQRVSGKGGAQAATTASKERERLAKVWPYPHGSSSGSGSASSGKVGGAGSDTSGGAGGGAAGGPASSRGRRGRAGVGSANDVAAGAGDSAAFPPLSGARDVKKVYVAYEYQTLDGRRFLATPQQLAAGAAAVAAVASKSSTFRDTTASKPQPSAYPTPAGLLVPQHQQNKKGQPARREAISTGAAADAAASAAAAATISSSSSAAAASFLLQHDAPLYLQPAPGLQFDPTAPTACDGAAVWDPTPRRPGGLAQLRRIFVVTPPSASGEPLLAARPTVQFRVQHPPELPRDAAAAAGLLLQQGRQLEVLPSLAVTAADNGGVATDSIDVLERSVDETADDQNVVVDAVSGRQVLSREEESFAAQLVSGHGPAATLVQVSLIRPVPLPPDSLVVISLPLLYGLPAEWLGWSAGLGEEGINGKTAGAREDSDTIGKGNPVRTAEALRTVEDVAVEGGAAAQATNGSLQGVAEAGQLVPLVQLDQRVPFEACLLAGSALFPIPAVQS